MFACKKHGFPVVGLFCLITGTSYGQGYYHSPNDTLIAYAEIGESVTMNITQVHTSNDTLQFTWNKLSVDIPSQWEASICDNSNCYTTLMENGTSLPVLPGDDGLMLLHCTPIEVTGTGVIRYTLFEIGSPQVVDTLTWIIHAELSGLTETEIDQIRLVQGSKLQFNINHFRPEILEIIDGKGTLVLKDHLDDCASFVLPEEFHGMFIIRVSGHGRSIQKKLWL